MAWMMLIIYLRDDTEGDKYSGPSGVRQASSSSIQTTSVAIVMNVTKEKASETSLRGRDEFWKVISYEYGLYYGRKKPTVWCLTGERKK